MKLPVLCVHNVDEVSFFDTWPEVVEYDFSFGATEETETCRFRISSYCSAEFVRWIKRAGDQDAIDFFIDKVGMSENFQEGVVWMTAALFLRFFLSKKCEISSNRKSEDSPLTMKNIGPDRTVGIIVLFPDNDNPSMLNSILMRHGKEDLKPGVVSLYEEVGKQLQLHNQLIQDSESALSHILKKRQFRQDDDETSRSE